MSSKTPRDLNDRPPAQPGSRNVFGIENACFPLSNNVHKGSDNATLHAGKPRTIMPPRTMTIQRLALEILAEILAALLHLHEVDLPLIDGCVSPFIRAVPAASQVWRANRKALLRRVALEQQDVLKRRAVKFRFIVKLPLLRRHQPWMNNCTMAPEEPTQELGGMQIGTYLPKTQFCIQEPMLQLRIGPHQCSHTAGSTHVQMPVQE
ncbi:hypothetical protein FN846DRAFT_906362 [Sphaerosporella brunnea]|uniref:Uncharacterized protein n=1 Tax=Sphaerosporella brunnea TaxID=1250544 RepID=A0A5J5EZ60_9PEZI|nr:hypothetical protein FN846DRAFT_906362 [Sphaerosporella brunnea]